MDDNVQSLTILANHWKSMKLNGKKSSPKLQPSIVGALAVDDWETNENMSLLVMSASAVTIVMIMMADENWS